jgi:hypothetical protein
MDLTQLELAIQNAIRGDGNGAIGTTAGNLKGINIKDVPNLMRSPCTALKWLDDNTPYTFQTFVELTAHEGRQGIRAVNKLGVVVKEISSPIYGGEDSDPMKIIYQNNKAIITETIKYVLSLQN